MLPALTMESKELLTIESEKIDNNTIRKKDETSRKSNVPVELLRRFKEIEKRTDEITKRSREKRIQYLQKSLKEKIDQEITLPEDREILQKYDVKYGPSIDNPKKRTLTDSRCNSEKDKSSADFEVLNQYLGVNDHLKGIDRGKAAPKSGLEEQIDKAIELGNFETAEKLSDRLSTREFGKKIADAFTAKDFMEKKNKEECSKRKKKKLNWGFEQKHRWETKSNM